MSALDFLNENSGAFTVVFSGLVTIATIVYVILTSRLVSETRQMRRAQAMPCLTVYPVPHEEEINWIDIVIRNIGTAAALDVKFTIISGEEHSPDTPLADIGFFKNGINYLAPGQKIQFFYTSMLGAFEPGTKRQVPCFEIKALFRDTHGDQHDEVFKIDLNEFKGFSHLGDPPLYMIARQVEKMASQMESVARGTSKIQIIMQTKDELKREQHEVMVKKGYCPPDERGADT